MPPDLREDELVDIGLHKWQLDCPRMTIKSRNKEARATYYGAGRIRFNPTGVLSYECYSHRERNTKRWDFGPLPKAGKLIPESYFYDVVATDKNGQEWRASRTIPKVHRTADGRAIIRGEIYEVITNGSMPIEVKLTGSSIVLWVFDDVDIPTNRSTLLRKTIAGAKARSTSGAHNAWQFTSSKIEYLLIRESESRLTVRIKSREDTFPDGFDRRVPEAFHLVLGKPLNWMAARIQQGQNIEVRIRRRTPMRGRLNPPLPTWNIKKKGSTKVTPSYHRSLFHHFMRHAVQTESFRHPIWGQLNAISESSGSVFIDAKALTLTVVIESLLATEFRSLGKPTKKTVESIDQIYNHVDSWDGDPSIKARTLSMVGSLKSSRAMDKMRDLAEKGAITKDQYEAWSKLRNPSAHSYMSSGLPTPKMVELLQKCEVLFYHLVFSCIGYEGPYIDYSTPGWPLKSYPGNSPWN
jgi:hypothetical protein